MSHNRIGCHTAYQHYEMFHGHKACCNSRSSIFNVVYNTPHCCSGSSWGGGFWGGIGMGIGMGIANFFGGMFGNMFGGGMGFGFPGFGGFGGGFGGGWGNFWGGNSGANNGTPANNNSNVTNVDYEKLNKLHERKNNLLEKENPSKDELQALLDDIESLEKNLDGNDDKKDKKYIEELKCGLADKIKLADTTAKDDAETVQTAKPQVVEPKIEVAEDDGAETSISNAKNIDDLLKCSPKTDEEKAAFAAKYKELMPEPTAADLAKITDDALRALVKKQYYGTNSNYDGKTELKDGDVLHAHDNSGKTRDTFNINGKITNITTSDDGPHPKTITINDQKKITYTYLETNDGEYLYKSSAGGQIYALQKTDSGKYELKQYSWHEGYGKKDWSV